MASFDEIGEAFVRLRPKAGDDFEADAKAQVGSAVGRIAENAALIFASKKIFDVGKAGIAELGQAAAVDAQTSVQLKNLGNTVSITKEQVDAYGQSMLDLAGFDDEAARSAANVLLRFGAIHDQGSLTRVGNDAADLAIAMGSDLPAAADTLGRALNNPEKAARLLKPAIGSLTDEQTKSIKAFQDSGDIAGAQGVILDAVEAKVKGTAAAYGDTLPAQLKKAQENLTNLKAALVSGVAPALELTAQGASFLTEKFQQQPEVLQQIEGGLLLVGGGLGALVRPAADAIRLLEGLRAARAASAAAATAESATEVAAAAAAAEAAQAQIAAALAGAEAEQTAALASFDANARRVASNESVSFSHAQVAEAVRLRQLAEAQGLLSNDALIASDAELAATAGVSAVAVGAEAVALEGEAVAAETATVANEGFLTSLGPIAIAAAAVGLALVALSHKGEQLSLDVHKFAGSSDEELLKVAHTAQTAFGGAEFGDFVNKLKDGGTEGVGALRRLRDATAAAGGDTSAYDKALGEAKTGQDNLTTSTQAGTDALGEFNSTASDTTALAKQTEYANNFAAAVQASKDKLQSLSDLASGAPASDLSAQRAALGVADSKQREADAQTKLNDAYKTGDPAKVAAAQRDLERANIDVKQSVLDAADANAKWVEAQDALIGKFDDTKDKAVIAHDSLAFFAQQLGTKQAEDMQPYVDQLQHVVDLQNELAGFNKSDAPGVSMAPGIQRRAGGGSYQPGWVLRGEQGPELSYEGSPGYVVPAGPTAAAMGGKGVTLNVHEGAIVINESGKGHPRDITEELRFMAAMATNG